MLFATLFVLSSVPSAAPVAAMSFDAGFVELKLRRDGKAVPSARIRVFDPFENVLAEGETGDEGQGAFPLPAGKDCRVGITIDGKECDLIPLRVEGGRLAEPTRISLTFGTRPCCVNSWTPRKTDEPTCPPVGSDDPYLPLYVGVGGASLFLAAFLFMWFRPSS